MLYDVKVTYKPAPGATHDEYDVVQVEADNFEQASTRAAKVAGYGRGDVASTLVLCTIDTRPQEFLAW